VNVRSPVKENRDTRADGEALHMRSGGYREHAGGLSMSRNLATIRMDVS
jgi:hypothetical protein